MDAGKLVRVIRNVLLGAMVILIVFSFTSYIRMNSNPEYSFIKNNEEPIASTYCFGKANWINDPSIARLYLGYENLDSEPTHVVVDIFPEIKIDKYNINFDVRGYTVTEEVFVEGHRNYSKDDNSSPFQEPGNWEERIIVGYEADLVAKQAISMLGPTFLQLQFQVVQTDNGFEATNISCLVLR